MAGDWIKMRIDLQSHPKIVRILSATQSDKFRAIGGLHAVWSIFDTHSEDGVLTGYSAKTLDHVIGWDGFTEAMIAVGWVEETPGGLVMPEFEEHNGKSGKRRAEDQKRKRESRKCPQIVQDTSFELRTREEKRREDIEPKSSSDQAAPDNAKAPAVPFQKIMDAYCQALPNLPQPQAMTEKRKTALRGIWREFEKCHADDFWQRYFAYVGKSEFLVGMRGIGIDWLINKANFYKVIEGNYHA